MLWCFIIAIVTLKLCLFQSTVQILLIYPKINGPICHSYTSAFVPISVLEFFFISVSTATIKHYDSKQLGEELGQFIVPNNSQSLNEFRARNQTRKKTRDRNTIRSHKEVMLTELFLIYWLGPHSLLSFLFCNTQDNQPRDGTTHRDLVFPLTIINPEKQSTG